MKSQITRDQFARNFSVANVRGKSPTCYNSDLSGVSSDVSPTCYGEVSDNKLATSYGLDADKLSTSRESYTGKLVSLVLFGLKATYRSDASEDIKVRFFRSKLISR